MSNSNNNLTLKTTLGSYRELDFIHCGLYESILSSITDNLANYEEDCLLSYVKTDKNKNIIFSTPEKKIEFITIYNSLTTIDRNKITKLDDIKEDNLKDLISECICSNYDNSKFKETVQNEAKELLDDCLKEFTNTFNLGDDFLKATITEYYSPSYYNYCEDCFRLDLIIQDHYKLASILSKYIANCYLTDKEKITNYLKGRDIKIIHNEKGFDIVIDRLSEDTTLDFLNYWFINELSSECLSEEGNDWILYHKIGDLGYSIYEYLSEVEPLNDLYTFLSDEFDIINQTVKEI